MISDRVQKAFENCLTFGDSEQVEGLLGAGRSDARFDSRYVSWDEMDLSGTPTGTAGLPSERPYDIGALLSAGAEHAYEAAKTGRLAFFLQDDGAGCWVFYAPSELSLVEELLRVGAMMESGG